jgi:hypothetical protein
MRPTPHLTRALRKSGVLGRGGVRSVTIESWQTKLRSRTFRLQLERILLAVDDLGCRRDLIAR